ncbi:Hypothetical protein CINCED_3A022011 [Cinara cedri]|uniref:Uncharacterized protein n=1 Tax=Cinara cedri TaxID=506608 RepID=A0A5E4N5E8_9HEMI|nr:Hypothetical protein CINCED_3A022011 [Cinara cedri]
MNARNIQLLTITMLVLIATPCMRAKPCFVEIVEVEIPNTDELEVNTEEKRLVTPKPRTPIPANTPSTPIPAKTPSTPTPANIPSTPIPANTSITPIPANTPSNSTSANTLDISIPTTRPTTSNRLTKIRMPIGRYKANRYDGTYDEDVMDKLDELGINTEEKQLVTPKPCIPIPENTSITSIPANTPSTPIPANTPSTSIPANTPSTPIPANTPKPIIQIPIGEYKTFTNVGPFEEGYFGFN